MAPEISSTHGSSNRLPLGAAGPWWLTGAVAGGLLAALAMFASPPPVDLEVAAMHHERAAEVEQAIPYALGGWVGKNVPVPVAARELLRPNVLISRAYENLETREILTLLIVQCSDAGDLSGHYPRVCYPAHGMELGTSVAMDWTIAEQRIEAMRYTFSEQDGADRKSIVVDNFMVLPTGRFERDMTAIYQLEKDRRMRTLGAAQVQLLTGAAMSDARRDEIFREVVERLVPMLEPFLGGDTQS